MQRKTKDSDDPAKSSAHSAERHVAPKGRRAGSRAEADAAGDEAAWDAAREEAKVMYKRLIGKTNWPDRPIPFNRTPYSKLFGV